MAEKLIVSPLTQQSCRFHSIYRDHRHQCSWLGQVYDTPTIRRTRSLVVGRVSSFHDTLTAATSSAVVLNHLDYNPSSYLLLLADATGYSLASYYTSLGLFVISVPGLWSLIKRSVKSKVCTILCLLSQVLSSININPQVPKKMSGVLYSI